MPHVTVRSKRTRLRIADIVISGVGDAGRTWHSAGSTARCGPTAVATLLRRFHPSGEMLEARHLHSNEHPVEGMFLQTFCSVPQGHRINACRRDGGVNTCEERASYHPTGELTSFFNLTNIILKLALVHYWSNLRGASRCSRTSRSDAYELGSDRRQMDRGKRQGAF